MPDYTLYHLKISTLTPLHIGSGHDLLHEYDYAIYKGQTWRINDAALLDAQQADTIALANQLSRTPPANLLADTDFDPAKAWFRYVIKGTPRSAAEGAQIREQLKNVNDQPFLPGSSLKGALRTAIGWHAWDVLGLEAEASRLQPRREWAGQDYEREIFGANPNRDLMRALQVSDSRATAKETLMVVNARVLHQHGAPSAPVEMEAIRSDMTFECDLKIDTALFSAWAGDQLRGREWLEDLPSIANAHSRAIISADRDWFAHAKGAQRVIAFYDQLLKANLGRSSFLLQLGWGGGWQGKTFGSHLQADEDFLEYIIHDYRLARGRRESGDAFPKSRRVAVAFQRRPDGGVDEIPALPLGWVLVEMNGGR